MPTGYKVIVTTPSGKVRGDDVVYTRRESAQFVKDVADTDDRGYDVASGYSNEIKLVEVEYRPLNDDEARESEASCSVGRTIHALNEISRRELIRRRALTKLNREEKEALGLTPLHLVKMYIEAQKES